jgi:hypothetical protein
MAAKLQPVLDSALNGLEAGKTQILFEKVVPPCIPRASISILSRDPIFHVHARAIALWRMFLPVSEKLMPLTTGVGGIHCNRCRPYRLNVEPCTLRGIGCHVHVRIAKFLHILH